MKPMQKSRAGQSVSDETVAKYTAARAFLFAEWVGALLMVASFTQLYWFTFARPDVSQKLVFWVGVLILALGTWMFWRSRSVYLSLDFPWRRKWEHAAFVVAGSGAIFWLLFLVLLAMSWAGQPVLPGNGTSP